jgi:uncharacterized protein YkwD
VQGDLTNQVRTDAHLAVLNWSKCLADVAGRHALEMANAGRIYHGDGVSRDLACGLGSTRSGENVGEVSSGIDDQLIFGAFMASPEHRANILGPYRYVGTAWVVSRAGAGYISVELAN